MAHLHPYEPFLSDYSKKPGLSKSSDGPYLEYSADQQSDYLKAHTSFMRPRLLNKRQGQPYNGRYCIAIPLRARGGHEPGRLIRHHAQ